MLVPNHLNFPLSSHASTFSPGPQSEDLRSMLGPRGHVFPCSIQRLVVRPFVILLLILFETHGSECMLIPFVPTFHLYFVWFFAVQLSRFAIWSGRDTGLATSPRISSTCRCRKSSTRERYERATSSGSGGAIGSIAVLPLTWAVLPLHWKLRKWPVHHSGS